jgi:hypothetical protein
LAFGGCGRILQQKGVDKELIADTLDARYGQTNEEALAREHLEKKRIRKPENEKETARVMRRLVTAGFSTGVIYRILRQWDVPEEALAAGEFGRIWSEAGSSPSGGAHYASGAFDARISSISTCGAGSKSSSARAKRALAISAGYVGRPALLRLKCIEDAEPDGPSLTAYQVSSPPRSPPAAEPTSGTLQLPSSLPGLAWPLHWLGHGISLWERDTRTVSALF